MIRRRLLILVAMTLGGASCARSGSPIPSASALSPTVPVVPAPVSSLLDPFSPVVLSQIQAGPHSLTVGGFGLSTDPRVPECQPFLAPRLGTAVESPVLVSREAGDIVVRSASDAAGDLAMRFHPTGEFADGGHTVLGTLQGHARYLGRPPDPARPLTAAVSGSDGAAQIRGTVYLSGYMYGHWSGLVIFTDDDDGEAATCTAGDWVIEAP